MNAAPINRQLADPGPFPLGRWIVSCAAAEAIGMSASAAAARASDFLPGLGIVGTLTLVVIVLGGLIEGLALGLFQSATLARWLPLLSRPRWVFVTALVAGLGWAAASAPSQFSAPDDSTPPLGFIAIAAAALGAVMGTLLGAAQAGGFRQVTRHPWRWIGISAVAWTPTMVIIFIGATTPGNDWSYLQVILLGAATGAIAGSVLGLVSGLLAPTLAGHSTNNRIVTWLLSSPGRSRLGKSVVVLRVTGRNSGIKFELPVQYARTGTGVVVVPGHPEHKQWWRNLRQPSDIDVLTDGAWRPATAEVIGALDDRYAQLHSTYSERWPRVRVPIGHPLVLVAFAGGQRDSASLAAEKDA